MASVALETVILSLGSDLSQSVSLEVSSLDDSQSKPGRISRGANGRRRVITNAGKDRTLGLTFDTLDRAELDTLALWIGERVLARDPFGRKEWCVFLDLAVSERVPVDFPEASLTLARITFSEAV